MLNLNMYAIKKIAKTLIFAIFLLFILIAVVYLFYGGAQGVRQQRTLKSINKYLCEKYNKSFSFLGEEKGLYYYAFDRDSDKKFYVTTYDNSYIDNYEVVSEECLIESQLIEYLGNTQFFQNVCFEEYITLVDIAIVEPFDEKVFKDFDIGENFVLRFYLVSKEELESFSADYFSSLDSCDLYITNYPNYRVVGGFE